MNKVEKQGKIGGYKLFEIVIQCFYDWPTKQEIESIDLGHLQTLLI